MKSIWRSVRQISFLLLFVFLLVRFFPFFLKMAEAAAIGLREFWWVILVIGLGIWLIYVLRSRNSG